MKPGILDWLPSYRRDHIGADAMAGLIVAIMLVPQAMAYALLAGLPPQVGLYASIAPLLLYAVFGSSRTLAVGPVAIVSLMVASTLQPIANGDPALYLAGATLLALLSGVFLAALGLLRLGFIVNFLSHPVISGFTSAAAIVIGASQLKHLFGLDVPRGHSLAETLGGVAAALGGANVTTLALGIGALALMLAWRGPIARRLDASDLPDALAAPLGKAGPLIAVLVTTLLAWGLALGERAGVATVGSIPAGLPPLAVPPLDADLAVQLLPAAALISLVGFLESVSVAKSLAAKRRERVDADRELVGLGAANIGASLTGGYPVTGGFSRSLVNFAAGAVTPMASIVTAVLVALTVLALTPLLVHLPKATLAAVILIAVAGLIDWHTLRETWLYDKADAASLVATFVAVLTLGIEVGILIGVALSLVLFLWRTSRPHMAEVGRVGDSEHFRNVLRHAVHTDPRVLTIRVDESLYFANTAYLEDRLLARIAERPEIGDVVLVMSAVNMIDASALETLETLHERLADAGVALHMAEVKGPVMDRLERVGFPERLGAGRIHLSTHRAMEALAPSGPTRAVAA